jgi:tetratricopeptide (TPR) repeat protein
VTAPAQTDAFSRRVVEVIVAGIGGSGWSVGSGLLVGPRLVLTSAHVLTGGAVEVRGVSPETGVKTSWPASIVDAGDVATADIALLSVADDGASDRLPMLRFVEVDRSGATPQLIHDCAAVGYPRFREIPAAVAGAGATRETAHVSGDIPVLDQLVSGLLTLRVSSSPRPLPALDEPLHRSEWSGMSGAVVTSRDAVIGVVSEHQPRAGQSELTVTPAGHVSRLGPARAAVWSAALGVDLTALPALSGTPSAPAQHFHIGRDLVLSQTVVPEFRARPVAPSPPAHFAGRRTELEHLAGELRQGHHVAITGIQGMGGIGKTALALQLAAEMTEFSAVLWASLGPEPDPVSHLLNWARHADGDFQAGDTPLDVLTVRVRAALTGLIREHYPGQVLVILDDVWEGDSVRAARLLQAAAPAGAVHLITTRSQLVVAQLRSTRLELQPIDPAGALQMLRNLLSDHPEITDEHLLELAAAVGHHPLAIELAAGQTRLLERPAEEITELIARYRGGVPAGSPFHRIRLELGESREDNLELVLSFSYAGLDSADQAAFRALGALAYGAPFDRDVCGALWRGEPRPVLDRLRHRAMLGLAPDRGWYQQHPLLRAYARALLHGLPDQRAGVEDAYTGFVTTVSEGFAERPVDRWADLEPYLPHVEEAGGVLVAASRDALERPPDGSAMPARMVEFALNTRRLLATRREIAHPEWLEAGLTICERRRDLGRVVLLLTEIGQHQAFRGDVQAAAATLHRARDVAESTGDRRTMARASRHVGEFFLLTDPDSGARPLQDALDAYERLGDARELTVTLLRMAEWHAVWPHPPEVRDRAAGLLGRARAIAERDGFPDLRVEAIIALGRLHTTFGEHEEAVPLLSEAVADAAGLRIRAREAVARVFLAAALADGGRLAEAEAELDRAVPLFSTVGNAPGQATALRNLGELHARQGRPDPALASFAAALPLVRKVTMRFLDEDREEPSVVPGFFTCQLEQVTGLSRIEQFRARAAQSLKVEGEPEDDGVQPGTMPDEVLSYLLSTTVRTAARPPADRAGWSAALADFGERLAAHGDTFRHEREFATALRELLDGAPEPAGADLTGTPYEPYLPVLRARIKHGGALVLPEEVARQYADNTFVVRVREPEHRQEWEAALRGYLRGAREWGDAAEEAYYRALLAVLAGRPAALPADHPYHPHLAYLHEAMDTFERRPADVVVEKTVAALTVAPGEREVWLTTLRDRIRDARRRRSTDEAALLSALTALASGEPDTGLPAGSPYRDLLEDARAAVAAGAPLPTAAPVGTLTALAQAVVEARTGRPKTVDQVVWELAGEEATAEKLGRRAEADLYRALAALAAGDEVTEPAGPYGPVVRLVLENVRGRPVASPAGQTLPEEQIAAVVTVAVAIEAGGSGREDLAGYQAVLSRRGDGWAAEAEFLGALLDLVDGSPVDLPAKHPYHEAIAQAVRTTRRHRTIRERGGRLPGPELDALLGTTAQRMRRPADLLAEFEEFSSGMLTRVHELAMAQIRWREELQAYRADLIERRPGWTHEIALLDALIDVVDERRVRLAPDNPYADLVSDLLADLPGSYDLPDSLATLGQSEEESLRLFRDRVSGRDRFVRALPNMLVNTVLVRTVVPESAAEWRESLGGTTGMLTERASDTESFDAELALLEGLREVAAAGRPVLPDGHPYEAELRQVAAAIDLFHGVLTWPGSLDGERISYLSMRTYDALAPGSDGLAEWRTTLTEIRGAHARRYPDDTETQAFFDALLVVADGRPADLPLDNRYWAYLRAIRDGTAGRHESP